MAHDLSISIYLSTRLKGPWLVLQHGEERAQLLFKLTKEGHMTLLPNEYVTRRLKKETETFIDRYKSIPAFTANLTMDNFQQQTQC